MLPNLPAQKNRPPRILVEAIVPGTPVTLKLNVTCKLQEFRVPVEDPDVDDKIRNKWFIDDESLSTGGLGGHTLDPSDAGTRRSAPVVPPTQIFSPAGVFTKEPGAHKLTVVIADGEFSEGINLVPRPFGNLSDGGTLFNPAYTDSFTWDIDTKDQSPCP